MSRDKFLIRFFNAQFISLVERKAIEQNSEKGKEGVRFPISKVNSNFQGYCNRVLDFFPQIILFTGIVWTHL